MVTETKCILPKSGRQLALSQNDQPTVFRVKNSKQDDEIISLTGTPPPPPRPLLVIVLSLSVAAVFPAGCAFIGILANGRTARQKDVTCGLIRRRLCSIPREMWFAYIIQQGSTSRPLALRMVDNTDDWGPGCCKEGG